MTLSLKFREHQILSHLANGLTAQQIADRLSLSVSTVRWYIKQLYRTLEVSSRGEAIRVAMSNGLLDAPATQIAQAPMVRSDIRYVHNNGANIAYQIIGTGPVDLLFVHGFVSHLDIAWENPEFSSFFDQLGRVARVILFDKRGVGVSDRNVSVSTLEQTVDDARCVLDAVNSSHAFIMGTSEGAAAAALLASMFTARVRGLILIGASPFIGGHGKDFPWNDDHGSRAPLTIPRAQQWGDSWEVDRFAPSRATDQAFTLWWSKLMRAATSPSAVATALTHARTVDIRALLPSIQTPALIVHRNGDRLIPVSAGRYFGARLAHARYVELPGNDHVYFVDQTPLLDEVFNFLRDPREIQDVRTWLAIMLCMSGPAANLNEATRAILETHGAKHLRHAEHSWTALFDGPTPALRAARALSDRGRGFVGGMSLHVGACTVSDGVPIGTAYSRVLAAARAAEPGEVLVTGTLRDILAGADVKLGVHSIAAGDDMLGPSATWVLQD